MYCLKCGTKLSENAKFCEKCSAATTNTESSENFPPTPANPYATASAPVSMQDVNAQPLSATAAPCEKSSAKSKPNPFAFVLAGINFLILALYFVPWWFFEEEGMSGVFTHYAKRMPLIFPEDTAPIFFLVLALSGIGMLLAGIIVPLTKKHHVPVLLTVLASLFIQMSSVFFCFTYEAWHTGVSFVPVLLYFMSFINIPFAILARVK